jgi:hypothetical protein
MSDFGEIAAQLVTTTTSQAFRTGIGRPPAVRLGETFGQWEIVGYQRGQYRNGVRVVRAHYVCRCNCGTVRNVLGEHLRNGDSKSCGHETGGRPPRKAS